MTTPRDPVRLTDIGSEASEDLASALRALRLDRESDAAAEALLQRVAARLAEPASSGASPTRRIWRIGIMSLPLFGALFVPPVGPSEASRSRGDLVAPPAVSEMQLTATTVIAPELTSDDPQPPLPAPTTVNQQARRRHRSHRLVLQPSAAQAPARRPDPEAELVLLRGSQAALQSNDLASSLDLVGRHASEYPDGVFAQEREVLAIETLLKQRARDSALQRAEQFMHRYGSSLYAARIRELLEQTPRTPAIADPDSPDEPPRASAVER
jgi:hypothetical protein